MVQGVGMEWLKRGKFWARCTLASVSSTLAFERWLFFFFFFFVDPGRDGDWKLTTQ